MLNKLNAEGTRLVRGSRTGKVLGAALGGVAALALSSGSLAIVAASPSGALTLASRTTDANSLGRAAAAERKAAMQGDLGIGSNAGQVLYTSSSCRGASGYGKEFLGRTWPGGFSGVPVFSNGVSGSFHACLHRTRTPKNRVVADGYAWQCVELVDRLYLHKGWIESTWRGNGNQMFYTAPRFLHRQRQGHIHSIRPGDVISFNAPDGRYGHAAVISRIRGNYLTIVNQNTNRSSMISHAHLIRGRIVMVGWAGWRPIGVVHRPGR